MASILGCPYSCQAMNLKCLHVSSSMASTLLLLTVTLLSFTITSTGQSGPDLLDAATVAIYSNTSAGCHGGSSVGDCVDEAEELMLDSHVSRRILTRTINANSALLANQVRCDKRKYADCLPSKNGKPIDTCRLYNRCRASVPNN